MKQKSLKHYVQHLKERCEAKFGSDFVMDNEEVIECAARNKRLLDRFDEDIDRGDLSFTVIGSTGQQKEDINPLIKHRNDVAKLYADNLDALFLTPRSKFKKTENHKSNEADPMEDYFTNLKQ